MVKFIWIALFFVYLILPASLSEDVVIQIRLLPFSSTVPMSLGKVILLFACLGLVAGMVAGLIDRSELSRKNKKLNAEVTTLRAEVASLRSVVTMGRDSQ